MALPTQKDIWLPLLLEIEAMGGEAKPEIELYRALASHFPQITEVDLKEEVASGTNRWEKHVNYARLQLVHKGEIDKSVRGVWRITEKGRQRLRGEGLLDRSGVVWTLTEKGWEQTRRERLKVAEVPPLPPPPKRHEELKQKMDEIGKKLGYYPSPGEGPVYWHDVLWKRGEYKRDPSHVIEICDAGSLPKDFDALNWANENWGARGILVVTDETDYRKAKERFKGQPKNTVVKADSVDRLYELIVTDLEFLKSIFSEQP